MGLPAHGHAGRRGSAEFLESAWRLGRFLKILSPAERAQLTIATKFGEHWDAAAAQPYVNHSYAALEAGLDRTTWNTRFEAVLDACG